MATNTYDAIVIGGGHNGLTAGAYFARHGARDRGPRGEAQDRRRRRHERPVRRPPRDQRHHLLLRDVADAADDHQRAAAEEARLRRHGVRPVLPGLPGRPRDHGLRRRGRALARLDRAVLEEGRGRARRVGGVAEGRRRHPRAAAPAEPAARRLARDRRPARDGQDRVEGAQARRPRRRRRHAPVHDEHHGPAGRLVRVRRGQGHARGERHHRDVGGTGRAGHRVRDAPPLDRRRRRRPPRLLGLPAGRHGRRLRLDPALGGVLRRGDPDERAREVDAHLRRTLPRRGARGRDRAPRADRRDVRASEDRVPRHDRAARICRPTSSRTSSGGRPARAS